MKTYTIKLKYLYSCSSLTIVIVRFGANLHDYMTEFQIKKIPKLKHSIAAALGNSGTNRRIYL